MRIAIKNVPEKNCLNYVLGVEGGKAVPYYVVQSDMPLPQYQALLAHTQVFYYVGKIRVRIGDDVRIFPLCGFSRGGSEVFECPEKE